jgi:hypothetical protein
VKIIAIPIYLTMTVALLASGARADQTAVQPAVQPAVQSPVAGSATTPPATGGASTAPAKPNESPVPAAPGTEPIKFIPASDRVCWVIIGLMTFILFFGVFICGRHLNNDKDWNFGDLMSGADGKPSASRMIAFLGFLVMTTIILGIGYSSLWVFLKTGQLPALSGASTFLVACAGLFTPYFANQVGLAIGSPSGATALAPVVVQSSMQNLQGGATGGAAITFGAPVRPGSI